MIKNPIDIYPIQKIVIRYPTLIDRTETGLTKGKEELGEEFVRTFHRPHEVMAVDIVWANAIHKEGGEHVAVGDFVYLQPQCFLPDSGGYKMNMAGIRLYVIDNHNVVGKSHQRTKWQKMDKELIKKKERLDKLASDRVPNPKIGSEFAGGEGSDKDELIDIDNMHEDNWEHKKKQHLRDKKDTISQDPID